ncbi:MAG: hypothetical protein ACRDTG_20865 [Pseudonocardiaceae bacterium]
MIRTEWAPEPPVDLSEEVVRAIETARYAYPYTKTLVALRGNAVVAVWVLPISVDGTGAHARRIARVLPYAAPVLFDQHPQRRRDVMVALLGSIREDCVSLDLPMAPDFHDVTACRQLGMAVEWRHTHVLDLRASWRAGYSATVRQHLRAAQAAVEVRTSEVSRFRFDLALVGQSADQVALRERFARQASARGAVTCLTAASQGTVGQHLILLEAGTGFLLHSWFDREGPRGVPTLLVDTAAETLSRLGRERLDLEGSVVPTVDYFMSGFGGAIVPYPHVYWHRDVDVLTEILMDRIVDGTEPCGGTMISRIGT